MSRKDLEDSLKRLIKKPGIRYCSIVKMNGNLIDFEGEIRNMSLDTYSAMTATIYGAGKTANDHINTDEPHNIVINDANGRTIIEGVGRSHIIVIRAELEAELNKLINDIDEEKKFLQENWLRGHVISSLKDKYG
ncbi:MAG: roadblock/LC7 domain-containing protein [Thermoplasmatota archaeon]